MESEALTSMKLELITSFTPAFSLKYFVADDHASHYWLLVATSTAQYRNIM